MSAQAFCFIPWLLALLMHEFCGSHLPWNYFFLLLFSRGVCLHLAALQEYSTPCQPISAWDLWVISFILYWRIHLFGIWWVHSESHGSCPWGQYHGQGWHDSVMIVGSLATFQLSFYCTSSIVQPVPSVFGALPLLSQSICHQLLSCNNQQFSCSMSRRLVSSWCLYTTCPVGRTTPFACSSSCYTTELVFLWVSLEFLSLVVSYLWGWPDCARKGCVRKTMHFLHITDREIPEKGLKHQFNLLVYGASLSLDWIVPLV